MKLSDKKSMIEKGGIPCDMWYTKREGLPVAIVAKTGSGNLVYGDNGVQYAPMQVVLFLEIYTEDEETEYRMDKILNNNKINFTYKMYYVKKENFCCKVYSFEVEED